MEAGTASSGTAMRRIHGNRNVRQNDLDSGMIHLENLSADKLLSRFHFQIKFEYRKIKTSILEKCIALKRCAARLGK